MAKILKPFTIIPPDLYVSRDADRQVKNIIMDMGRPGYVLVSRQMGKTNLLFNAKRELETADDVFIYIDLSNHFENAKSCFENIIDTAIDTNPEKFEETGKNILERRENLRNTPPHKQHANELRFLLNAIEGKLVIILDEIDALINTNYSDQIFSQIRSIYFSRINFPELNRLTYILSGVIEPTEIIKDPKISPFNIGQKIFLNDFSKAEFNRFLENVQIFLSKEIKERIYKWASGNPRMTWDICSEIENRMKSETITKEIIDEIVEFLYLTKFDKPPIDNIRELVKKDRELRNSIYEIEYKKGREISDRIKSKLYLAGIINYEYDDVHIKNDIIRKSVNLKWIRSIDEEEKGLVKIGLELIEKENFSEALKTFERYLEDNEFNEEERSFNYYHMGYAAYRVSNYSKALVYLNNAVFDLEDESKMFYRIIYLKGLINYFIGNIDESLSFFNLVINSGKKDEQYVRSLLNIGSVSIRSKNSKHKVDAIKIFEKIIDESGFDKSKLKPALLEELKSIAHFNLAQLLKSKKDVSGARNNYQQAILLAKDNTKPIMLLNLYQITENKQTKIKLLNQFLKLVFEENLIPGESNLENPIDFSFDNFKDFLIAAYLNYQGTIFKKLQSKLNLLGEKTLAQHIYDLAFYSISNNADWKTGQNILFELYKHRNIKDYGFSDKIIYNTIKLIAYYTDVTTTTARHKEYIEMFQKERLEKIDYLDMEIFANLIFELTGQNQYELALNYTHLINSFKPSVPEDIHINYIVIYHLQLNLYLIMKLQDKAHEKAFEILEMADNDHIKRQKSNLLGETGLDVITRNAKSVINETSIRIPVRKSKSYGRNEFVKVRYKDGTVLMSKYKKIEEDLSNGECFILN